MLVNRLTLQQTRLYDYVDISLSSGLNILYGANASGKTTVIESLFLLSLSKSHKATRDVEMIQHNQSFAKINANCRLLSGDTSLEVIVSKQGKKAKINGLEQEKLSQYIGTLNVVLFAPEDLGLIKGNPKGRRVFVDQTLTQVDEEYLFHLLTYQSTLKERNEFLKMMKPTEDHEQLLTLYTNKLMTSGQVLMDKRKSFLGTIAPMVESIYEILSETKDQVTITYRPSILKDYEAEMTQKKEYDQLTKATAVGPHRDDILFTINGFDAKTIGSQGEIRTIVLALKLALTEYINQVKGDYPILLLDDVFSELDKSRKRQLITYLQRPIQTIITTTNQTDLRDLNNAIVLSVQNKAVKELTL
jgi:DNA replication and repair protein RecF